MKLTLTQIQNNLKNLDNWASVDDFAITKEFTLENFVEALSFVNKIGELAESQNHHPDISISYNVVSLILSTHSDDGVSEKDFTLAQEIDRIAN